MFNIKPFKISVSEELLNQIAKQINDYPWHLMPDGLDWSYGTNKAYLIELCDYWVKTFDWRKSEQKLNKFCQFTTDVLQFGKLIWLEILNFLIKDFCIPLSILAI